MNDAVARLIPIQRAQHPALWIAFVATAVLYVAGDGLTTLVVLVTPSLSEMNGFVEWLGPIGFVVAKLLLLGFVWALLRAATDLTERDYSVVVLVYCTGLATLGAYLTVTNLLLIVSVY